MKNIGNEPPPSHFDTDDAVANTPNTNLSTSGLKRKDSTPTKSNFVLPALGYDDIDLNGTPSPSKSTISSPLKSNDKLPIGIPLNLLKSNYSPKTFGNNAQPQIPKQTTTFQSFSTSTSTSKPQGLGDIAPSPVSKQSISFQTTSTSTSTSKPQGLGNIAQSPVPKQSISSGTSVAPTSSPVPHPKTLQALASSTSTFVSQAQSDSRMVSSFCAYNPHKMLFNF